MIDVTLEGLPHRNTCLTPTRANNSNKQLKNGLETKGNRALGEFNNKGSNAGYSASILMTTCGGTFSLHFLLPATNKLLFQTKQPV